MTISSECAAALLTEVSNAALVVTKEQLDELVDVDVAKDAANKREKYLAKKNAVKDANPEKLWKTRKPKDIGVMEVCAYQVTIKLNMEYQQFLEITEEQKLIPLISA